MSHPVSTGVAGPPAEPQPRTSPFHDLVRLIALQPGMVRHLEGVDLDGDGVADLPMPPPPHDPTGWMYWQALLERRRHASRGKALRKQANNRVILGLLRAYDPLHDHVRAWVVHFLESQPASIARALLEQVERTPAAYLEMYEAIRRHLIDGFGLADSLRGSLPGGSAFADARSGQAIRRADPGVRQGPADERTAARARGYRSPDPNLEAERQALIRRVKAGGAREGDLLRYLELCGI